MATLASRTKDLSGLPSGTLAAHLAAISLGKVDRLVSMMTVSMSEPCIVVDRRPAQTLIVQAGSEPSIDFGKKRVDVQTRAHQLTANVRPEAMTVRYTTKPIYLATVLPKLTVHRKTTP